MGHQPWPVGVKILRERPETVTLHMTLPRGVAEMLADALELAARLTGSEKLGTQMAAIASECMGEWQAQAAEAHRVWASRAAAADVDDTRAPGPPPSPKSASPADESSLSDGASEVDVLRAAYGVR
jgi:hypothetical protein